MPLSARARARTRGVRRHPGSTESCSQATRPAAPVHTQSSPISACHPGRARGPPRGHVRPPGRRHSVSTTSAPLAAIAAILISCAREPRARCSLQRLPRTPAHVARSARCPGASISSAAKALRGPRLRCRAPARQEGGEVLRAPRGAQALCGAPPSWHPQLMLRIARVSGTRAACRAAHRELRCRHSADAFSSPGPAWSGPSPCGGGVPRAEVDSTRQPDAAFHVRRRESYFAARMYCGGPPDARPLRATGGAARPPPLCGCGARSVVPSGALRGTSDVQSVPCSQAAITRSQNDRTS